jgi:amidohydrolase
MMRENVAKARVVCNRVRVSARKDACEAKSPAPSPLRGELGRGGSRYPGPHPSPSPSPSRGGEQRIFCAAFLLALICAPSARAESPEAWLKDELAALADVYKDLHQSPELSFQEEKTAAKMAAELRRLGFETTEKVGGHGVVGVLKNGDGPTVMLRADMDALPVVEETGRDYASKVKVTDARGAVVGVMHACGHDMHMTNLVGTLRYLAAHKDQWHGTLMPIFQPAEERGGGAEAMLNDGLFSRFPRPDYAVALHVAADRETGKIAMRGGYALANVDSVDITIHGRGGHGAYPHMTVDPIVIAARLVLDLQTIVSREVKPIEPAVVTVGAINGGTKHNIIGDDCRLQLTVRSFTPEVRKQLIDAIRRKAKAQADSAGAAEPTIEVSDGTPALYNDPELIERLWPVFAELLGEKNVEEAEPSMGGEDFGRFGGAGVPIAMISIGSISSERMEKYHAGGAAEPSLHSPLYYPEVDATITTGVKAFSAAALELLQEEE